MQLIPRRAARRSRRTRARPRAHGGAALDWRPARALLSELVGDDRRALELWLATVVDGREWTAPGRYVGACRWIERVTRAGRLWACPFEFVSYGRGVVLRARSAMRNRDGVLQALPRSGRVECAVTRWLSEAFPDVVPRVIACDHGRRWLLMEACAGLPLEGVPDMTARATPRGVTGSCRSPARYAPMRCRRSGVECVTSLRSFPR